MPCRRLPEPLRAARVTGRAPVGITVLAALLLAGCAPASDTAPLDAAPPTAGDALTGTVTVFAAASLRTTFDEIATAFETRHPRVDVVAVYDGSSTLAVQVQEGAHADVFAAADENSMQVVVDAGLASDPVVFATNTLVVAVPVGNPADVTALADLSRAVTVLCAPEVPCGVAATRLLDDAGVSVTPASLEQNVTAVLQKVAAGEADAGLVYATDVLGDAAVESFVPVGAGDVVNRYPVVALDGANAAGVAFAAFVLGDEAQQLLQARGFGAP